MIVMNTSDPRRVEELLAQRRHLQAIFDTAHDEDSDFILTVYRHRDDDRTRLTLTPDEVRMIVDERIARTESAIEHYRLG